MKERLRPNPRMCHIPYDIKGGPLDPHAQAPEHSAWWRHSRSASRFCLRQGCHGCLRACSFFASCESRGSASRCHPECVASLWLCVCECVRLCVSREVVCLSRDEGGVSSRICTSRHLPCLVHLLLSIVDVLINNAHRSHFTTKMKEWVQLFRSWMSIQIKVEMYPNIFYFVRENPIAPCSHCSLITAELLLSAFWCEWLYRARLSIVEGCFSLSFVTPPHPTQFSSDTSLEGCYFWVCCHQQMMSLKWHIGLIVCPTTVSIKVTRTASRRFNKWLELPASKDLFFF